MSMNLSSRWGRRTRRSGVVVVGVAGLVAAQLALFGGVAHAAPPSSVWIESGVLRVQSPAGQVNAISLTPSGAQVFVRDVVGNLAAQFPCLPVDAHTVRCPGGAFGRFLVDTADGNDRIVNSTNRPGTIIAGAGNDVVADGPNNQVVSLGTGNDFLSQGFGRDLVFGGPGIDTVSYAGRVAGVSVRLDNAANDGQAGEFDDIRTDVENATGGAGNDLLIGSAAANVLRGLGGNDTISAGGGNDFVDGGFGRDSMFGGAGIDTVSYQGRAANVSVRLDNAANDGQAGEQDNAHTDLENIIGGNGNDVLVGSAVRNVIQGLNGNDSMFGLGGNDLLLGGNGNDFASGGTGIDSCVAETETSCEN